MGESPNTFLEILNGREKSLPTDRFSYPLKSNTYSNSYGLDTVLSEKPEFDIAKMSFILPYADGNRRDGVGDVLEVSGIDCSRHIRNAIILFDHGKQNPIPLGKCNPCDTDGVYDFSKYLDEVDLVNRSARCNVLCYQGKGLRNVERAKEFDHAVFCEQFFDMWTKGLISAGSIGYQVRKAAEIPPDYARGIPKGAHLIEVLKLECSAVILPANADTTRTKSLNSNEAVERICYNGVCCRKPLNQILYKSLLDNGWIPERKAQLGYETKTAPDYETKALEDHHKQGRQAALRGVPQHKNPHAAEPAKSQWTQGHAAANRDMIKHGKKKSCNCDECKEGKSCPCEAKSVDIVGLHGEREHEVDALHGMPHVTSMPEEKEKGAQVPVPLKDVRDYDSIPPSNYKPGPGAAGRSSGEEARMHVRGPGLKSVSLSSKLPNPQCTFSGEENTQPVDPNANPGNFGSDLSNKEGRYSWEPGLKPIGMSKDEAKSLRARHKSVDGPTDQYKGSRGKISLQQAREYHQRSKTKAGSYAGYSGGKPVINTTEESTKLGSDDEDFYYDWGRYAESGFKYDYGINLKEPPKNFPDDKSKHAYELGKRNEKIETLRMDLARQALAKTKENTNEHRAILAKLRNKPNLEEYDKLAEHSYYKSKLEAPKPPSLPKQPGTNQPQSPTSLQGQPCSIRPGATTENSGCVKTPKIKSLEVETKSCATNSSSNDKCENPSSENPQVVDKLKLKSLDVTNIRTKYRSKQSVKGLRRRVKRSSPGKSVCLIHEKDIEEAKKLAGSRGVKFEPVVSVLGGKVKVRLTGDDKSIDEIAMHYGRTIGSGIKFKMMDKEQVKILIGFSKDFPVWKIMES